MPYVGAANVPGRGIDQLDTATNVAGPSAGQQAVIAYLQSKGLPVNPANISRAVMANAREPGSLEANGPNLGPVVLNLRNAGIEDASPMPSRGGGRTSALPTPPIPPTQPDRTVEPSLPSDRVDGYIPTPGPIPPVPPQGGAPMPGGGMPPPLVGDPVTQGVPPQLPPPPAGAAAVPPLGPEVLQGRSLIDLLRYGAQQLTAPMSVPALRMPMTPEAQRQIVGPAPVPQIEGPPPRLALPAPATTPQISGPPDVPRIAAPQPNLTPQVNQPALQTAGVNLEPAQPPTPASAAIDKAVGDEPQAKRARKPRRK